MRQAETLTSGVYGVVRLQNAIELGARDPRDASQSNRAKSAIVNAMFDRLPAHTKRGGSFVRGQQVWRG